MVPVLDDPGPCSVVSFCCGMEMSKDGGEREGLGGGDGYKNLRRTGERWFDLPVWVPQVMASGRWRRLS